MVLLMTSISGCYSLSILHTFFAISHIEVIHKTGFDVKKRICKSGHPQHSGQDDVDGNDDNNVAELAQLVDTIEQPELK